jgi:hypothetical protein
LSIALGPGSIAAFSALFLVLSDLEVERLGLTGNNDTTFTTLCDSQGSNNGLASRLDLGVLDESAGPVRNDFDSFAFAETAGSLLELSLGNGLASSGAIGRPVGKLSLAGA